MTLTIEPQEREPLNLCGGMLPTRYNTGMEKPARHSLGFLVATVCIVIALAMLMLGLANNSNIISREWKDYFWRKVVPRND